jgi:aspartate aminotransferase-like enzyme
VREFQLLMIPGPTPVPPSVLRAHSRPMMNHRGPEFKALQDEVISGLKQVFQTKNDVFLLTCSGTGAMEAAIVNVCSPGDLVLAYSIGVFGDRFAKIASAFGAQVEKMDAEWGKAIDVGRLQERLKKDGERKIKAVLVTHNESSTGVTNDAKAIAKVVREHGALLLVDAVSSLAAIDLQTDAWGIDVVASASQKALMNPPGLGFVSVSERAWKANETAKMPRFYMDIKAAKDYLDRGQTPWTPAVPQVYGLQVALQTILSEGLQASFERHRRLGQAARDGAAAMGLKLFADPTHASNTVTAIRAPQGLTPAAIRKHLLEKYSVVLAGGQQRLLEEIFRIGHMGYTSDTEILACLAALGTALNELGFPANTGAGLKAAGKAIAG